MPQIQVLPAVPQISPAIAAGIAQAGGSLAQAFQKRVEQQKAQKWMDIIQNPDSTSVQQVSAFMNLPPDIKKSAGPALAPILGARAETEEMAKRREAYHKRYGAEPQAGGLYGQAPAMPMAGAPGQVPPQGQQMPGMGGQPQATPDQIAFLEASPDPEEKAMGQALRKNMEVQQGVQKEGRGQEMALSTKYLEKIENKRETINRRQNNLNTIEETAPDVGAIDYIARATGFEPLVTAKGARFKTAAKDFYIDSLKDVGNRPNQWIEQQVQTAMEQIGKTPEANLAIKEIQQFALDLDKKEAEISDRLSQKYRDTIGYVPGRIGAEVAKEMDAYVNKREDIMAYKLRSNEEKFMPERNKKYIYNTKVRHGTPMTLETAQIFAEKYGDKAQKVAKGLGYKIMSDEFYMGLEQ